MMNGPALFKLSRNLRLDVLANTRLTRQPIRFSRKLYSTKSHPAQGHRMVSNPPPNEMVYLPGILSPNRSFGVFRKVVHTGLYSQFVAMEIPVNGEIGDEKHTVDQILLFTHGTGKAIVAGKEQKVKEGDVVIVPAGTQHQFLNAGDVPLEVVTIYSPAEHDPRTIHETKAEGDAQEEAGEDEAPQWSQRSKPENEKLGIVKVD